MARTSEEEQRRRRRKLLLRGLLLGGAAVGVPALANALIARRSRHLDRPTWGRGLRHAWKFGEIAYQRLGDGAPIVLLHSFGPGHDSEEWKQAAERLAGSHRVLAPDLLGWGRSDKPAITYDGELYIQLIADFLEDVVGERCTLLAAGLPGAYAAQVAVDFPERVQALGLVVPSGLSVHGDEPDIRDALVHWALRLPILGTSAMNLYTSKTALGQYLRRDLFSSAEHADAPLVDHYYQASHQPGAHRPLAAFLAGYLNHRVVDALGRLSLPLWLAWGRSASPAIETADLWLQQTPHAQLEVFEHSANLPHLEEPGRFCERFERFLEAQAESAGVPPFSA